MSNTIKVSMPYITGAVIAVVLFIFPEAKPIACGLGFAIPAMLSA